MDYNFLLNLIIITIVIALKIPYEVDNFSSIFIKMEFKGQISTE